MLDDNVNNVHNKQKKNPNTSGLYRTVPAYNSCKINMKHESLRNDNR